MLKKILAAAAIAGLISAGVATPADAASKRCGVTAAWKTAGVDTSRYVKTSLSWRWTDEASRTVEICARAEDRRKSKNAAVLVLTIFDGESQYLVSRGGNVAELRLSLTDREGEPYGVIADGFVRRHNTWAEWDWSKI